MSPKDNEQTSVTYLHVLSADAAAVPVPKAACRREAGRLIVTVGDLSYTFAGR